MTKYTHYTDEQRRGCSCYILAMRALTRALDEMVKQGTWKGEWTEPGTYPSSHSPNYTSIPGKESHLTIFIEGKDGTVAGVSLSVHRSPGGKYGGRAGMEPKIHAAFNEQEIVHELSVDFMAAAEKNLAKKRDAKAYEERLEAAKEKARELSRLINRGSGFVEATGEVFHLRLIVTGKEWQVKKAIAAWNEALQPEPVSTIRIKGIRRQLEERRKKNGKAKDVPFDG